MLASVAVSTAVTGETLRTIAAIASITTNGVQRKFNPLTVQVDSI